MADGRFCFPMAKGGDANGPSALSQRLANRPALALLLLALSFPLQALVRAPEDISAPAPAAPAALADRPNVILLHQVPNSSNRRNDSRPTPRLCSQLNKPYSVD